MRVVLPALAVAVALLAGEPGKAVAVEGSGWSRFHDPKLGISFQFPAHIFPQEATDEGERGAVFSTADGRARLRVVGFVNSRNQTPRSYLAQIPGYRTEKFHYVRTTSRFYIVSGVRDGVILYRRCNFSRRAERRVSCLQLEYPQNDKRPWDEVVTRISRSLHNT
jgi:hypothetical protein